MQKNTGLPLLDWRLAGLLTFKGDAGCMANCSSIEKNNIENSLFHVIRDEDGVITDVIFPEALACAQADIAEAQAANYRVSWERFHWFKHDLLIEAA